MKFNKKILASFAIATTSLLMVPVAFTIVSCSNNSPSLKDDALTNIRNNILNKPVASWTLPSTVTNENLNNVLNLNDFSRTTNNGFEINNLQIVNDSANDIKGTLEIQFELTNGDQKTNETLELTGFLNKANESANKNPVISESLNMLNVEQLNGKLITNVTANQMKPSFESSKDKPITDILSQDNEVLKKLYEINAKPDVTVKGLDQAGEPVVKNGITLPIIRKTLELELKENDQTIAVSSPFTLEIQGFSKALTSGEVKQLIQMGIMVNPNTIKKTFASEVTEDIASATSTNKTTLFNQDLSNDSNLNLFDNYNDITIQYQKGSLKNPNNNEGSIEATFDVKMSNAVFKTIRQENSFSVSTKIYGFIIGNPEEFNVFTEMDFYSSQKLMAINLYGRNLLTDINKYKIEYADKNGEWIDDSNNWELQLSNPGDGSTMSAELFFKRKTVNSTIENIRVSDVNYPNNNLVRLVEKRNTIQLTTNTQNAKTFNLDSYTAANAKTNKFINEKWIIDNKKVLFAQNTADLVTQPTDIKKLTLTVDGENNGSSSSTILRTLTVNFEILAGKYYDEFGVLATKNLPISFKINNFANYEEFGVINAQIDATTFILNDQDKLSAKTKGELLKLVTPEWLLENKTKFFNGSSLIKNASDLSVSKVDVAGEENTKATLSVVIQKGKYYDQFGYYGKEDKQVTLEFINLFDFKVLGNDSLIKNDFTAIDLNLNNTSTAAQNIDLVTKEWLLANKDNIWDAKSTTLIKETDDIESISAKVDDSDKTKLNVTVSIKADKSYNSNGLPNESAVQSNFTISGFKTFNELTLVKSEFTVTDFGLDPNKTGMENEKDITAQKILDKKDEIWGPEATSLITSVDDIVINEIKKTTGKNKQLDVKIQVNKSYDSDGLISTTPKKFKINIDGFKDFTPFTLSGFELDLTATSVGLSPSDKLADVVVDASKIELVTEKVQDILDSKIDNLSKPAGYNKRSSIIVGKFGNLGDKLLISIKVENIYGGNGLSSTTGPYDFHVTGFTS